MNVDPTEFKDRQRQVWAAGDYPVIAQILMPAARALVDACAISAGQEVLDVGAGTGNLALLAAEEGADVVASDLTPRQVELGQARTEAEGVDVEWVVADAEELPFEDDRFDCAASVFGVVFAPRWDVAAHELFRVVKPGGTVGFTSWGYYGVQGELFDFFNSFAPPEQGVPSPRDWGDEETVNTRLEGLASSIRAERVTMRWEFASDDEMFETFMSGGPGAAARRHAPAELLEKMRVGASEIIQRHNTATGGGIVVEPEYLQVVSRKRG